MPYSVVDFETTGILPAYHHRVVEVGVTHVEDDGTISGRWESLVNPSRDLGPQGIHGIRGADLFDAPRFEDIAGDIIALLRDRTFVAHNAGFDIRFLVAELSRAGLHAGNSLPHICTMRLAGSLGLSGRRALDACCSHYGVSLVDAHSAGADSYATAQLLGAYVASSSHDESWRNYWSQVADLGRGFSFPIVGSNGVAWKPRGTSLSQSSHFLERIAEPPVEVAADGAELYYLEALDRCLIDGVISATEGAQLVDLANELGLPRSDVESLHLRYLEALTRRAWADGVLTSEEETLLHEVARMLAVDASRWDSKAAKARELQHEWEPSGFTLNIGDHVVLTGEMRRDRSSWEQDLEDAGYVPHPRITKKTRLLVSADPDSLSGKAQQARKYGVPVVGEDWLEEYLC